MSGLLAHLGTGVTTTCRCWALTRRDKELLFLFGSVAFGLQEL